VGFENPETALDAQQPIDNRIVHQVPIAKIRTSEAYGLKPTRRLEGLELS
jgi:hypothetical protein